MLGCTSDNCKFRGKCLRYWTHLPVGKVHTLEPLADFGIGSSSSAGTMLTYVCGELGNYKAFIKKLEE